MTLLRTIALAVALILSMGASSRGEEIPVVEAAAPELSAEEKALKELNLKKDTLAARNAYRDEQLKQELRKLVETKQRADLEHALSEQTLRAEMATLTAEKQKLELENGLEAERQKQALAQLKAENERFDQEMAKQQKTLQKQLQQINAEKEKLALENALALEQQKSEIATLENEKNRLALENEKATELAKKKEIQFKEERDLIAIEMARVDKQMKQLQAARAEYETALARLETDITFREKEDAWKAEVNRDLNYLKTPFEKGILSVSDRRIALNGVIIKGTADYVTKRIHYFNNKSTELPIFLMIDRNPGGSVMEGYRIIKAMEASKAPIHVVVKSYAASMAAVIAAMAEESYAYPNAIVLHHQPLGISFGNLTQQKEQFEVMQEWAQRLHTPLAKRMGMSLEKFYKKMYEENSEGDWQEFADVALKLKWIDHIVEEVREEGIEKMPEDEPPAPRWFFFSEKESDQKEPSGIRLPRPDPFDYYFIHNPDGMYLWD